MIDPSLSRLMCKPVLKWSKKSLIHRVPAWTVDCNAVQTCCSSRPEQASVKHYFSHFSHSLYNMAYSMINAWLRSGRRLCQSVFTVPSRGVRFLIDHDRSTLAAKSGCTVSSSIYLG